MSKKRPVVPLAVLGFLSVGALLARAQDEPDLNREKRLHRIYSRLNSQPTSDAKWGQALQNAKSQTYKVQNGDTLWDISQTFFADPDFWPKIWSLNGDQITNPHEIRPDSQVQFVAGTIGEPPTLAVAPVAKEGEEGAAGVPNTLTANPPDGTLPKSDDDDDDAEEPKAVPHFVDIDLSGMKLPAPTRVSPKNPSAIPESLPHWKANEEKKQEVIIDNSSVGPRIPAPEVSVLSYVQEKPIEGVGVIVGAEGGMSMAHENQYVSVRLNQGAANQKFLVAREVGELPDDGHVIQIEGEVLVQEPVNDRTFRALVTRAHSPIMAGYHLIPGDVQKVTIQPSGASTEANARVVGGPESVKRNIFGTGQVLFLEGKGGLTAGQDLTVFRNESIRDDDTDEVSNPRPIASVHVVRTGDRFATAVVTSSTEEIRVGDSTTRGSQVK